MKLSKRLQTIVDLVPLLPGKARVADIGTDHGFVPIRLVLDGKAKQALAMDVGKGPLLRAQEHIRQYGLEGRIGTRLSDGLKELNPGEADVVVMAGMGGDLMLRILRDGSHVRDDISWWILSPQSDLARFRHGLEELGLMIWREVMLEEDGKYYTVMAAKPGRMHYSREFQYRYGDCLIRERSPVLLAFLEKELRQYQQIANSLAHQEGEGARKRRDELLEEIKQMEEAYDAMQGSDQTAG